MALLVGHAATTQVLKARSDNTGADALSQAAQGLGSLMEPAVLVPTLRGLAAHQENAHLAGLQNLLAGPGQWDITLSERASVGGGDWQGRELLSR